MRQLYKLLTKKLQASFYILVSISLIIVLSVSCGKDVLEIVPKSSYTESLVFDDPDLSTAHVNYAYRLIPWGFKRPLQYARVSDEISGRGGGSTYWRILQGFATPTFNDLLNIWTATAYSKWPAIKQCNEFLAKTESSKLEENILNRLRSEAKTIRAYCYFRLASFYGGVPLITKPFSLDDDWRIPRDSYDDVMQFVLRELDEAIPYLPLTYSADNNGRLTKGAAMAIKARAWLYYASPLNNPGNDMTRYQKAADAAKAVIDLGIYQLYPDYKKLFQEAGAWNSEVIWARPTNSLIDQEARIEQLFYPNGEQGFGQVHPLQNLVDEYEMLSGLLPKDDPTYDPQNPYVNRDPRFYYCILYNGAPFRGRHIETFLPGGMDSPEGPISGWNATETGYYPCKFITETYSGIGWDTSNPPWIWFRYGEVLLNYAEAMFKLGHEDSTRYYINLIRSRPGVEMPAITESGEALWEKYVHERRIEMVFEEARFFDVRRWKIAEEVFSLDRKRMYITKDPVTGDLTYEVKLLHTAYFPPHMYWAPIPQEEIDKNGLLEQNPGYD